MTWLSPRPRPWILPTSRSLECDALFREKKLAGPGSAFVAEGTPEQVAKVKESYTGRLLAPLLPKATVRRAAR